MPPKPRPAIERAWPKIQRGGAEECWLWTGATNSRRTGSNRYGHLSAGPDQGHVYAHRLVYEHIVGPIPTGLTIDHLCRNSLCCNPAHMEVVTRQENLARSASPSALNRTKEHCLRGHSFDELNTRWIDGNRFCRSCERLRRRAKAAGVPTDQWVSENPDPSVKSRFLSECKRGHPYDEANTHYYPDGKRCCRACSRLKDERRRRRRAGQPQ